LLGAQLKVFDKVQPLIADFGRGKVQPNTCSALRLPQRERRRIEIGCVFFVTFFAQAKKVKSLSWICHAHVQVA
jgi:hypothetical protein